MTCYIFNVTLQTYTWTYLLLLMDDLLTPSYDMCIRLLCHRNSLSNHLYQITTIHICHTDELLSHPCDIASEFMTYEWDSKSSVWHLSCLFYTAVLKQMTLTRLQLVVIWLRQFRTRVADCVCSLNLANRITKIYKHCVGYRQFVVWA